MRLSKGRVAAAVGGSAAAAAAGYAYYASRDRLPPLDSALQPGRSLNCRLSSVEAVSRDSARFTFSLPTPKHKLGLPVAAHLVAVRAWQGAVDASSVSRAYTPVTVDGIDEPGSFALVIKRYPNGFFSEQFHKLKVGDTMDFQGPVVTFLYAPNVVPTISMIAAGTGITPMYQILRAALTDAADLTTFDLLYASRTEEDILLRGDLDELAAKYPKRLRLTYVVSAAQSAEATAVRVGRIGAESISETLPPPAPRSLVLVCGPEGLMNDLCGPRNRDGTRPPLRGALKALGYQTRQVVRFDPS
ncbi:hypothetical protein M885DRAFT_487151 [Pelagophyceae sp. CCMP2097]|nr:hypothetical protein M885DRAFT_487151 [Pelagophyceae sp. CCMP2097]